MVIKQNVALRKFNTFGLNVRARYMAVAEHEDDTRKILREPTYRTHPFLILGGGSNLLFSGDYQGLVLKNNILGKDVVKQDHEFVWLRLGAGENWHQVVLWAIDHGWGGIENLSLIPGTVGAAPMQNIGAYGVELCSVFDNLESIELSSGSTKTFDTADCDFSYRYSVFKGPLKDQFIITRVVLKLRKHPVYNISYGAVAQTLEEMGVEKLSVRNISNAVIKIRESKLPDPEKIGNAGSFFKNPVVDRDFFNILKSEYTNIPYYHTDNGRVKIPAGWLIEQCDWKGFRRGSIGVHHKQALVLVNFGDAQGQDLVQLASEIQHSVQVKFGIKLDPEVNIV